MFGTHSVPFLCVPTKGGHGGSQGLLQIEPFNPVSALIYGPCPRIGGSAAALGSTHGALALRPPLQGSRAPPGVTPHFPHGLGAKKTKPSVFFLSFFSFFFPSSRSDSGLFHSHWSILGRGGAQFQVLSIKSSPSHSTFLPRSSSSPAPPPRSAAPIPFWDGAIFPRQEPKQQTSPPPIPPEPCTSPLNKPGGPPPREVTPHSTQGTPG